jgi:polyphosphate kinase 2
MAGDHKRKSKGKGKNKSKGTDGGKMKREEYERELKKLQTKLCLLQDAIVKDGKRVIIVFEGRDAAGKGGTIKALTERVNPRVFRTVALPAPSDREKTLYYAQRFIQHFPAAGEVVIFDRSWYNRAGVEYVMGFCTKRQYKDFVSYCPEFESHMVHSGIQIIKFWLEVGQEEQRKRFDARIRDPLRQWKLSPMDLESYAHWYDYSDARDLMLDATDTKDCPWTIVPSDDKRKARLNILAHILRTISHKPVKRDLVKLPKRIKKNAYDDKASLKGHAFVKEEY